MNGPRLSYEMQLQRLEQIIDDIEAAYRLRDFPRLVGLANRLATDGVIAGALSKPDGAPASPDTAHAA